MQIVIDIPDGYVGIVMRNQRIDGSVMDKLLRQAVIDGTPLPKEHGRMVDVDELFWDIQTDEQMRLGEHLVWVKERIDDAPTIIEADKAESEAKK